MDTIINYTTNNDGYRSNGRLKVKGIMLHSTATPGIMAKAFRDRFNKPGLGKSVHGFLDDVCYVQCLPYDKKAGHCRYAGNDTHIGIELCEPMAWQTDHEYFDKVYENALQLVTGLCVQFGLDETNVIDHAEGHTLGIASNHSDVGHWFPLFGKNMDLFRADVARRLAGRRADIRMLQQALNHDFGEDLQVDGVVGPKTLAAAAKHLLRYKRGGKYMTGKYVLWVQQRLLEKGYDIGGTGADGKYGKHTADAVRRLQTAASIAKDGIVGKDTLQVLVNA